MMSTSQGTYDRLEQTSEVIRVKPRSDYTILARFWDDLFVVGCLEDSYTTMGVGTQDSIVSSRVVCHSARQPMSCLRCFTT